MDTIEKNSIRIIYGHDIVNMTKQLLDSYDLKSKIGNKSAVIGLKPNLVLAAKPEDGATTHIEILVGVIEYLQNNGFKDIIIIEGSWVGDSTERAFSINGYDKLVEKYSVKLLDTKKDCYEIKRLNGIQMEISSTALKLDYLINLPVLKGHCQTVMTNALKNMKGLLSDKSKRMFHQLGLMKPIAALNSIIHGDITIVDNICGDIDFEEGGNPVETWRMLLAEDPVLLDSYCATLLGFAREEIEYIKLAENYGVGSSNLSRVNLIELNKPESSCSTKAELYAKRLSIYTDPDSACSCCYANLIHALKRIEEKGNLKCIANKKIAIGQGWKGKECEIGVGACCFNAKNKVVLCPPKAEDIIKMLESLKY